MALTSEEIESWSNVYKTTKKLPALKIPCNTFACENLTTLCHNNLHDRVERFGSIENLLNKFKCRGCVKGSEPKKVPVEKKKKIKVESNIIPEAKPIYYIPKLPTVIHLLDNLEEAAKLTSTECMRPDIYLDNNRSCTTCSIVAVCSCRIKSLTDNANVKSAALIRRK